MIVIIELDNGVAPNAQYAFIWSVKTQFIEKYICVTNCTRVRILGLNQWIMFYLHDFLKILHLFKTDCIQFEI